MSKIPLLFKLYEYYGYLFFAKLKKVDDGIIDKEDWILMVIQYDLKRNTFWK